MAIPDAQYTGLSLMHNTWLIPDAQYMAIPDAQYYTWLIPDAQYMGDP